MHQCRRDRLRRDVTELRGDRVALPGGVGEPEPGQHPARSEIRSGRADLDSWRGAGPERGQLALRDQTSEMHHADVRADLLDLGEQVGGEHHGRTAGGERR